MDFNTADTAEIDHILTSLTARVEKQLRQLDAHRAKLAEQLQKLRGDGQATSSGVKRDRKHGENLRNITEYLRAHGTTGTGAIAKAVGMHSSNLSVFLRRHPAFLRTEAGWTLKPE